MIVTITLQLNGVPVPIELDDAALATLAAGLATRDTSTREETSPFMTIVEAAEFLRCSRQRVDDLLSARRLPRVKDGARTLIRRSDLDAYLENASK